jgi:hypothetical protein
MPILLEFLAVKSSGWREVPRVRGCGCVAPKRADVVADKDEGARKVVVTIEVQTGAAFSLPASGASSLTVRKRLW